MSPEELEASKRKAQIDWQDQVSPDAEVILDLIDYIGDLEAQLATAREALEKIWNMGHNDDCIFCGLKDSVAVKWMPQPEVWQAENPTATPPSPEVGA